MNIPIDQVIAAERQQAIHIAQQILPIVLQSHLALTNHELITRDHELHPEDDLLLPPPSAIVEYALLVGTEFINQANALLNQPVPGLTGTT